MTGLRRPLRRLITLALCAVMLVTTGCSQDTTAAPKVESPHGKWGTQRTFDNNEKTPPAPVPPPPPRLDRDPRTSVYSYLLWISFAYRVQNSEVATHTFSPYEEVRINSYVQYNKQQARAIDQQLMKLNFKGKPEAKEDTSTVAAAEQWKYRYIDVKTGKYKGPWLDASYDTTYTVIFDKKRGVWLVDKVEAKADGEVK